jgi:ribosome-associated translation inhibitor RaiA
MNLHLHLEQLSNPEPMREACNQQAAELHADFPNTTRVSVTVRRVGSEYEAHVCAKGKDVEVASRARSIDVLGSLTDAFDKTRRQLRKNHDKTIFVRRREAQRASHRALGPPGAEGTGQP